MAGYFRFVFFIIINSSWEGQILKFFFQTQFKLKDVGLNCETKIIKLQIFGSTLNFVNDILVYSGLTCFYNSLDLNL